MVRDGRGGFSIVDLLVSLAVMVVLIAILLPSLAMARESANRVRCAQNMRQFAIGLSLYTMDSGDTLPNSVFNDPSKGLPEPQNTIFVHLIGHERVNGRAWDGLGRLFGLDYVSQPEVYYCPSHSGNHSYERHAPAWLTRGAIIGSNYQYRVQLNRRYASLLDPWTVLISDGMRTPSDYNHGDGNNMVTNDGAVKWVKVEVLPEELFLPPSSDTNPVEKAAVVNQSFAAMDGFSSGSGGGGLDDGH